MDILVEKINYEKINRLGGRRRKECFHVENVYRNSYINILRNFRKNVNFYEFELICVSEMKKKNELLDISYTKKCFVIYS